MSRFVLCSSATILFLACIVETIAQQPQPVSAPAVVPPMVSFSGLVTDVAGKPLTGMVGLTFSLYKEAEGGAPLWMETQNVQLDENGHYSVMLGSSKKGGIDADLFASGEARWLGVEVQEQPEQARILLLSVPYALKAADSETLGGRPATAYMLNPQQTNTMPNPMRSESTSTTAINKDAVVSSIAGTGTTGYISRWTSSTNLGNSIVFQSTASKLGIGTTSPAATIDIHETTGIRATASGNGVAVYGDATVASGTGKGVEGDTSSTSGTGVAGVATATTGNTQGVIGGSFSTTGTGVLGQAEATSGNTFGVEGTVFSSSGVGVQGDGNGIGIKGLTTSASGTAGVFNNTGGGKVLSGQVKGAEVFSVNGTGATVNGNLTSTGAVTGNSYQIGSNLFAFGSYANGNAFLGFAGNITMTGGDNSASGYEALDSNTTGYSNSASGSFALYSNTLGGDNSASGGQALYLNTTGGGNTASGFEALYLNTTGYFNTAIGDQALGNTTGSYNSAFGYLAGFTTNETSTTGSNNTFVGSYSTPGTQTTLNNATAIGANAQVTQSNSLVLGSIKGVNSATASTNVGISTTAPTNIFTIGQGAGQAIADGWVTYSSRRWKTNIHPLDNALNKVQQLRAVSYDLKDSDKHEIGVIAEEVGRVVPEVVSYEANGKDARGVDYSRLTALLIEAVKQQQKQITAQRNVIRTQQRQISGLSRKVGILESNLYAGQTTQHSVIASRLNGLHGSE